MLRCWLLLGMIPSLAFHAAIAQDPLSNDSLDARLSLLRTQAQDLSLGIGQREALVLEIAAELANAAQAARGLDQQDSRWRQAAEALDQFSTDQPGHPRRDEFQLQAAVYTWARGISWRNQLDLNPLDATARTKAVEAFDDAIHRLKPIPYTKLEKNLGENCGYRLARAIADRADLEAKDQPARELQQLQALQVLATIPDDSSLRGFSSLLKADLLCRLNRLDEADAPLKQALSVEPPLPERDVLDVRLGLLAGRKKFAEAETVIAGSQLSDVAKQLERVRMRLAMIASLNPGDERYAAEQELFRLLLDLRSRATNERRLAFIATGQQRLTPDSRHEPMAWDLLAEAGEVIGERERASALEEQAAKRAEERGDPEAAAGFRLRAGGFLFQAEKYKEAGEVLIRIVKEPKAGALRAKAGMLRVLALGRLLETNRTSDGGASYLEALREQIRDFPDDPSTNEARWLLGVLYRGSGRARQAEEVWNAIPAGSPRWLDARLGLIEIGWASLEDRLSADDQRGLTDDFNRLSDLISKSQKQAKSNKDQAELLLAFARLNLLPVVGKPRYALDLLERLTRLSLTPLQQYRMKLLRIIGLIQVGPPYLDAEREAKSHATWADPAGQGVFLDVLRLLDQCASHAEADLRQRRFGLVSQLLMQNAGQDADDERWTPDQRSELRMRRIRAYLFLGDSQSAKAALSNWTGPSPDSPDALLRDLADTYNRLEAYALAIDVQRLRLKNLASGSPAWFEARYGLALACFRAGDLKQATQLIDATSILHPELGGGSLRDKFIKLRQRLGHP